MIRNLRTISISWLTTAIMSGSLLHAQSVTELETRQQIAILELIHKLNTQNCINDLPAPILQNEPRYTKGTTNTISFRLPTIDALPLPAEYVLNPYVITKVLDGHGAPPLNFPKPVNLENDSTKKDVIGSLKNGRKYTFTTALFVPLCAINCGAVTDSSQLELHCSAFEDTVWSIQDFEAPLVQNARIPELQTTAIPGWWNQSSFRIQARLTDPAGVWQGFLFRRACSSGAWERTDEDTTFTGILTDSGFLFSESGEVLFAQNVADGCYDFRVEGRDATHTPESYFPKFQLAGNGGTPAAESPAQLRINIDTTPPLSVELNCAQELNTIELNWSISHDSESGIGLAGYYVFRDLVKIAALSASVTHYVDSFAENNRDADYFYQIQPFDSLGNTQHVGGTATCSFRALAQLNMIGEPQFTPGKSNEICWSKSELVNQYTVNMAQDCNFDNPVKQVVRDTCFTFFNLVDGANYCYWVTAVDQLQRIVLSDTVWSRQDASVPEISSIELVDAKLLNGRKWVKSKKVEMRIVATDRSPGEILKLEVDENGANIYLVELNTSVSQLDTTLLFDVSAEDCQQIDYSVSVFDKAENISAIKTVTFYRDTLPPGPVAELKCEQLFSRNGIKLVWTSASEGENCSGLAGYLIYRDNAKIAQVGSNVIQYDDIFPQDTQSATFVYQVQPFDSLGNVQKSGGQNSCSYLGLSAITLNSLPEFTPGSSREICWNIRGLLNSIKLYFDENGDFVAEDSVLIENPPENESCYVFQNLKNGRTYHYWLIGTDARSRTAHSDTVTSIQDSAKPVVDSFTLVDGDFLNGQLWTNVRNVSLRIAAHDTQPGEIREYELFEDGLSVLKTAPDNFSHQLNELISHQLQSTMTQPVKIELAVKVRDGAQNESDLNALSINFQENFTSMFAFPNPFNPLKGSITIRLETTDETEVKIYDFFGNLIQTVTEKANSRDFVWDGRNGRGELVASGGYICVGTKTKKRFKIALKKQNR